MAEGADSTKPGLDLREERRSLGRLEGAAMSEEGVETEPEGEAGEGEAGGREGSACSSETSEGRTVEVETGTETGTEAETEGCRED